MSQISQNNIHKQHVDHWLMALNQLRSLKNRLLNLLQIWINRHQQRKQLASLDDRMLKDIGVSASQVNNEINKPFWK